MSTRSRAAAGTAFFFFLGPCVVGGLVPWWITRWRSGPAFGGLERGRWVGAVLAVLGLVFLVDSFARFAVQGLGTPAPVAPTRRLVLSGPYRHTRNPMYIAVLSIVLGQALFLASLPLVAYAAAVAAAFHLFVVLYEEPTLRASYGEAYEQYLAAVPRWRVRLAGWEPPPGVEPPAPAHETTRPRMVGDRMPGGR